MKNFDTKRFGNVLKLDFAEGMKPMMWGVLCMVLLYLFFFWFAHEIAFHNSRWDYVQDPGQLMEMRINTICEAVGAFGAIAMFIFFLIAASTLYRGEQKKQQRIAWLMLPASNLEKFTSRWIYLLVFSIVGGLLPFFVADLIHMVYLWMTGNPVMSASGDFFEFLPHTRTFPGTNEYTGENPYRVTMEYSFFIGLHAFFLLGGVFFKKFHFIATSAVFVLLFVGWAMLYNALGCRDTPATSDNYIMHYICTTTIFLGLVALFTWLAYRLFCRWQVVTNKFVNV
jgi:hypothetical protein